MMSIVRALLFREMTKTIAMVTLVFLSLFFFFDLVEEYGDVGTGIRGGYSIWQAVTWCLLMLPNHAYGLLPITVLIGSIIVLARLAQTQEFTIMRVSGLGPYAMLGIMLQMGGMMVCLCFALGDYVGPLAQKQAESLKSLALGKPLANTGTWLRESRDGMNYSIRVQSFSRDSKTAQNVRIYAFDRQWRLHSLVSAASATLPGDAQWNLQGVTRTVLTFQDIASDTPEKRVRSQHETLAELVWPSAIHADMVAAALLNPNRMNTLELLDYTRHLRQNGQGSHLHDIAFWRKLFYPAGALVMVILALPFAYLHFRSGSIAAQSFAGILLGTGFFILTNIVGYLGYLYGWLAWLSAALPVMVYLAFSLLAFGWMVLRR